MQSLCILGSTGSIGESTLKVVAQNPEKYQIFALTSHSRISRLVELCLQFKPKVVVVPTAKVDQLRIELAAHHINDSVEIWHGEEALIEIAADNNVDVVMAAIVGAAGLAPTLSAINAGKKLLLANKEALVLAGELMMQAVRQAKALLLPVDSEHNAIFQSLSNQHDFASAHPIQLQSIGVEKLILTASGGPFRSWTAEQMQQVTPAQACKHPNWSMGEKISVDSATMVNKGLELIEASHLFQIKQHLIDIVIHPQSIVHSLVQYSDGSTLAQMGTPDMCTPIAHALAWPERIATAVKRLDLMAMSPLQFYPPDESLFPCLKLSRQVASEGGTRPAQFNAANEVAVAAFLSEKIRFTDIATLIDGVLQQMQRYTADNLELILEQDKLARNQAEKWLAQHCA